MSELSCQQIVLGFAKNESVAPEVLEELAECCADALDKETRFVALGPVVSCNFDLNSIEVEFTVAAESEEQAEERVGRVAEVIRAAIVACEYRFSDARLAVPA